MLFFLLIGEEKCSEAEFICIPDISMERDFSYLKSLEDGKGNKVPFKMPDGFSLEANDLDVADNLRKQGHKKVTDKILSQLKTVEDFKQAKEKQENELALMRKFFDAYSKEYEEAGKLTKWGERYWLKGFMALSRAAENGHSEAIRKLDYFFSRTRQHCRSILYSLRSWDDPFEENFKELLKEQEKGEMRAHSLSDASSASDKGGGEG